MTLPVDSTSILYLSEAPNRGGNTTPSVNPKQASGILKNVVDRQAEEETKKISLKGKRHAWLVDGIQDGQVRGHVQDGVVDADAEGNLFREWLSDSLASSPVSGWVVVMQISVDLFI
ncbi:hypothetical protein HO133_001647 [Letharia lupina]|uniref:Uncharacterized protein n=1 Tax=Letharia lupina TaxID=560253 RepID=A0A8H6CEC2_9LECA|nr:uncharacterized protein HO133_001647 [Letharia lupina]KAF6221679.1 hypothetical protein HO133_001647 [Letharia lupina]